jgi:hypothetical protein
MEAEEGEGEKAGMRNSTSESKGEKKQFPDDKKMGVGVGVGAGEKARLLGECDVNWDIRDGDFATYGVLFSGFPFLKHHAHQFFIIINAIPRLTLNWLSLTPEQKTLFNLIISFEEKNG